MSIPNVVSRTGYVNSLPSASYLRELFRYSKTTGHLYWRKQINPAVKLGVPISYGRKLRRKRAVVRINGTLFYVSRVIWKLMTGRDPGSKEVDHRNRRKWDDRWSNLQLLTREGNLDRRKFTDEFRQRMRVITEHRHATGIFFRRTP